MRYFVPLALFLFVSCSSTENDLEINKSKTTKEINNLLDKWHQDAADAKFTPYFSLFSEEGIYIGTDAKEIWTIDEFQSFAKPYFDKGKAWSFSAINRNIYFSEQGKVAWFDELLNTWMGKCRGSGVFQKVGEDWKLEHYVLSLTVPNEKMDSVINVIR